MFIKSTAVTLLTILCLQSTQKSLVEAATPITLIDATGALSPASPSATSGKGVVAILTSPGTKSPFLDDSNDGNVVSLSDEDVTVVTSPGATFAGDSYLAMGNGAAAVSTVAGSIILSGITESDLEKSGGLGNTRHGQTLSGIFRAKMMSSSEEEETGAITSLIVAVPVATDEEALVKDIQQIFKSVQVEFDNDADFDALYDITLELVESEDDAAKIMEKASQGASQSPSSSNVTTEIANIYTKLTSKPDASPSVTTAILSCDDSFARNHRTARAKLSAWKARTARGLTIDNFGLASAQLLKRTMELYDRDTIIAAGLTGSAAPIHRLNLRSKLQERVESAIRDLFKVQVEVLEKTTLKKFNGLLLRKHGKNEGGAAAFYADNEAAVRSAAFVFDTAMEDLEVPSLSLTKTAPSKEMKTKLNSTLLSFPDSAAARLKDMNKVTQTVNKAKQPTERSVDIGLDLVAMIRPDGFGNLQGFAGYQLGGNNIIVGIHNDADSPDVISQFGGTRPPFLRVQPKLKLDVEL